MNRIESYLRRNFWLRLGLRFVVVGLVCFWAFPGMWIAHTIAENSREQAAEARRYPPSDAKQAAVDSFARACAEKAKRLGSAYKPKVYFEDLHKIEEMGRGQFRPQDQIGQMMMVMQDNLSARRITRAEIDCWVHKHEPPSNEPMPRWYQVLGWLIARYSRFVLLAVLLYLLRMVDGRGILETILADKKAFAGAVLDWPHRFLDYPGDMRKEIQVEAELRRIGGLFRRLNPVEYRLIREIASAENFKERLHALREAHRPEYQRGLVVAMLAAFVCLLILPRASEASAKAKTSPQGLVMAMARAGPTVMLILASDHHPTSGAEQSADFPRVPELLVSGSEPVSYWEVEPPRQEALRRIDHIPVVSLSVLVVSSTGARQGDHGNAYRVRRTDSCCAA